MSEDAFLRAIAEAPVDDEVRRVYADWLEDQGDPRASFLRAEVALASVPFETPRASLRSALVAAAVGIDPTWLATVSRVPIVEELALIGSWHMEGLVSVQNVADLSDRDADWKPDRVAPQGRAGYRAIGYIFEGNGDGHAENRSSPLQPSGTFTWQLETDGLHLCLASPLFLELPRIRIWIRQDGRMLWANADLRADPWHMHLLIRDDPPATFRGAPRRRSPRTRPG